MLRLRNRLLPLLRGASPLPSSINSCACRLLSTSTSTSTATVPAPFSLEGYLVAACGFAPTQAHEVSKKALKELSRESRRPLEELSSRRLISASNPDAILALLSDAGLSGTDIAAVVSADPLLLRASVKNIASRLVALRDRVGLSTPQIARFLLVASRALRSCDVAPKERVKEFLLRAEELGVPAVSQIFMQAVALVASCSKEKVAAKLEFLKRTLGCSESEVSIAVSKMPRILGLSDVNLLRKIEFLVNEAAMEPQYIVQRPVLLAFSLEKRLMPRHLA